MTDSTFPNSVESHEPKFLQVGEIIIPQDVFEYLLNEHGLDSEKVMEVFSWLISKNSYNTQSLYNLFERFSDRDSALLEYEKRTLERKIIKTKAKEMHDLDMQILLKSFSPTLVIFILYVLHYSVTKRFTDKSTLQVSQEDRVPTFEYWLNSDDFKIMMKRIEEGNPQRAYEIHEKFSSIAAIADMFRHNKR